MTDDIPKLRAAIDAIDDKLLALLGERCGIVKQVGAIKKATQQAGQCFVRAGREADMVRRMATLARKTSFPPAAAAQMWRLIISASLTLESELSVTACATPAETQIAWLTREYFGGVVDVATEPNAKSVIGDVLSGKAQIGAVPMPDDSIEGDWWKELPEGIRIFACVPFVFLTEASPKALLVAKVEPEATGDDVSLLRFTLKDEKAQSRLNELLEKLALAPCRLAGVTDGTQLIRLVQVKGFFGSETFSQIKSEMGSSLLATDFLGAYAVALTL